MGVRVGGDNLPCPESLGTKMVGAGGWKIGARWSKGTLRGQEETEMREEPGPLLSTVATSTASMEDALCASCSVIFPRRPSSFSWWRFMRGGGLALIETCELEEVKTGVTVLLALSLSYSSLLAGTLRCGGLFSMLLDRDV